MTASFGDSRGGTLVPHRGPGREVQLINSRAIHKTLRVVVGLEWVQGDLGDSGVVTDKA